ncbi:MAG TPA: hypothetical protein PKX93_10225, partial [bacterium]|nr:hypothetical protein [bacterium]
MSPGLKRWSVAIFVFGLTLFFSGPARAGFRLEMEAEEADGVAFYPDWHTMAGQGWYAMEQKYFSGYAGLICDAQSTGARATFTLKQAIPPGRYRFFLYLVKMREGGKNGLQVKLGSEQWDVIWDGSTYPVRDYAVQAHDLVLTEPAKEISFTSLMIQRHNIGDVPGYPLPAIMLDRFLLTDDLSLKVIRRGSRQDVGLVDLSEEKIRPVTASLPSGNRLRNGSFEVGTTTTWFSFGQPLGPENLVAGGVDGQRCLLLPSGLNWPSRGIFSSVFSGSSGEKVPVSLFLKSSRDTKIKLSVIASTRKETPALTVKANENWQKFETVVSLPEDATGRYSLAIRPESDDRVDVWVDACSVGLAQGQDYLPDREQEFALQSERLANIYHDRENVPAILTVANHASKIYQSELEIVIRDHRDAVTGRQRISLICQAGKRQEKKVNLACGRWGIFSAVLTEKETGKDLAELCYINLPAVSERNELIGFYGSAWNERNMAIFEDLGIAWIATLADGQARHIRSEGFEELVRVLSVPARHRVGVVYATEILFH